MNSRISFHEPRVLAFEIDGHLVDLRARYSILNVQFDFCRRQFFIGIFGESRAATIGCLGVSEYFSQASQEGVALEPAASDGSLIRPDNFEWVEDSRGLGRNDGQRVITLSTEGGFGVDAVCEDVLCEPRSIVCRTGAGMTAVDASWLPQLRAQLRAARQGRSLDVAEIDLANRIVRLVVTVDGERWLIEYQGVVNLRLGPAGEDMVMRPRSDTGSGAPISKFSSARDQNGLNETWRLRTVDGFELSVSAALTSVGPVEKGGV